MAICSFALLTQLPHHNVMRRELTTLLHGVWSAHVNRRDYQGGWDVLALRCAAEHQQAHPLLQSFSIAGSEQWQDLPALAQSPHLSQFIHSLACPVKSVRLMRLHPGAVIKPHKDHGLCLEQGEARLHVPLQTNERLNFYVNGKKVPMQAGDLWYINADQEHRVENQGTEARINLVIDCQANTWLREQVDAASVRG